MRKFFILNQELKIGGRYFLDKEDSYHVNVVLRMNKNNEIIIVCDGKNGNFRAEITNCINDKVEVLLKESYSGNSEPDVNVHLYMALIKADKFEMTLQKCAEVGVFSITPVQCERSVVKIESKKVEKKVARWNKIVLEACKQCQRSYLPVVHNPVTIKQAAAMNRDQNSIICYVEEEQQNIKETLKNIDCNDINIFIGPEGGFTNDEIMLAKEANMVTTHLGGRILRAETAAIVGTTVILYDKKQIDDKHSI